MSTQSIAIMLRSPLQSDIYICKTCKAHFFVLKDFIVHKIDICKNTNNKMDELINSRDIEVAGSRPKPFDGTRQTDLILLKNILNVIKSHATVSPHNKPFPVSENNELFKSGISRSNLGNNNDIDNKETASRSGGQQLFASKTDRDVENVTPCKSAYTPQIYITTKISGRHKEKYMCGFLGCSYACFTKQDMERHSRIHTGERPFICPVCNKRFNRGDKLQIHIRIHSGHKPHKCTQCDYASVESGSMVKHMRIHENIRPYKCQLCSYRSRDKSQLTVHLRTHTGDAPFMCTVESCKSAFKTKSDLKRHSNIHLPTKAYSCSLCPFRSSFKTSVTNHTARMHPDQQDGVKKPHCCPHCTELPFKTIRKLNNHIKKKHNIETKGQNKTKKQKEKTIAVRIMRKDFKCSQCSAAFVCSENLHLHELQHKQSDAVLAEVPDASNFYADPCKEKNVKSDKGNVMLNDSGQSLRNCPDYLESGDLEVQLKTAEMLASLSDLQLPRTYSDASAYFNSDDELNTAGIELNL